MGECRCGAFDCVECRGARASEIDYDFQWGEELCVECGSWVEGLAVCQECGHNLAADRSGDKGGDA